jgi:hypothetical protein
VTSACVQLGTTITSGDPIIGAQIVSITTGDVNADGNLDILTANSESNNVTVLLGR